MLDGSLGASLRRLDLADNQLTALGDAFRESTALEHLSLASNRLTSVTGESWAHVHCGSGCPCPCCHAS